MLSKFSWHHKLVEVHKLPPCVAKPRNKKDEIYNAVIGLFQAENFRWTPSEVNIGIATSTVKTLTDTLRYVDGYHNKLSEWSCEIPVIFKQFFDFSKPEVSKHKKQSNLSLQGDVLQSHCQCLFPSPCWIIEQTRLESDQMRSWNTSQKPSEVLWSPQR